MANWLFRKITDYWDQQIEAIDRSARVLEALPPDRRDAEVETLRAAIAEHTRVLSDRQVADAAVFMADNLYKAVSVLSRWDGAVAAYLSASAGAFLKNVSGRSLVLQYVVDNTFQPTEVGMRGPLEWYPTWFRAAGLVYVCPQHAATELMASDGARRETYIQLLPRYIDEGRLVTDKVLRRCHNDRRHFFFVDTDSGPTSFDLALRQQGTDGVISIFRVAAPVRGSRCAVSLPPSLQA